MFNLITPIPQRCYIACSGGIDSMVLLDFALNAKKNVSVLYFNHRTEHGQDAQNFVQKQCHKLGVHCLVSHLDAVKPIEESEEEFWRNKRYEWFNKFDAPVLTAHHLGDAMEWWLFSSIHGEPKLIPAVNRNVLRPLLATSKDDIVSWAERKNVEFIDDPSNQSRKYMRNVIRHDIMPHVLHINKGFESVIRKKYMGP